MNLLIVNCGGYVKGYTRRKFKSLKFEDFKLKMYDDKEKRLYSGKGVEFQQFKFKLKTHSAWYIKRFYTFLAHTKIFWFQKSSHLHNV